MKKYMLLFHDTWDPTAENMAAWQTWFAAVGDRFVDSGNPFASGFEITRAGISDLAPGSDATATGYSILSAESREDVERLIEGCPFDSSVRVYEASAM
jgi:hypothetical protein